MKKFILFTLTLFLTISMLGCPSRVNIKPLFVRLETVDGEEVAHKLIPIDGEEFNETRDAFYNNDNYDGESEFNYRDYYNENYIIYEYVRPAIFDPSDPFDPEVMLDELIADYNIAAIDYDQTYVEVFADRDFNVISENITITSFYDIWLGDEDANFDGVVDEKDEPYYDDYKTDEDGNYVYDSDKLLLLGLLLPVGDVMDITLRVFDEDGAIATIDGIILIKDSNE